MEYKKDILNLLNDLKSLGLSRREVEERLSYKTHFVNGPGNASYIMQKAPVETGAGYQTNCL